MDTNSAALKAFKLESTVEAGMGEGRGFLQIPSVAPGGYGETAQEPAAKKISRLPAGQ